MAYWTVIGTGDDVRRATFGLTLDTNTKKWTVGGPDVDNFFITKNGSFDFVVIPENGTQLVGANGAEVAFLTLLNGASQPGAVGTGRASERAVHFNWRLDSH